ncbi:MAG: MOSC domain-containing protein [Tepidiformaceae bacterium]
MASNIQNPQSRIQNDSAHIVQLSRSGGGVPKLPIVEAEVTKLGIAGDSQNDTQNHGGPERALCLYAIEVIEALAAEGHAMAAGATGENITTRGLDWSLVVPGARLRLGAEVLIEVTRYTTPCYKNARWFMEGDFNRMHQNLFPGQSRVYARVLHTGSLRPGDLVELV